MPKNVKTPIYKRYPMPPVGYTFTNAIATSNIVALIPESKKNMNLPDLMKQSLKEDFVWAIATKVGKNQWDAQINDQKFELSGTKARIQKELTCYTHEDLVKNDVYSWSPDINLDFVAQKSETAYNNCRKELGLNKK